MKAAVKEETLYYVLYEFQIGSICINLKTIPQAIHPFTNSILTLIGP